MQKGRFSHQYILLSIICLISILVPYRAVAQDLVTVSTGEWEPFISKTLPNYGVSLHIVSAAFSKVNIEVQYIWLPWARAMKEVEEGRIDVSAVWVHNSTRAEKFIFSSKIFNISSVFFYHKDSSFDWHDLEKFPKDMVLGVSHGYSYGEKLDQAIKSKKVKVDVAPNHKLNFAKLIRKRVTVVPGNQLVAKNILASSFSQAEVDQLQIHPRPFLITPLHIIANKKNDRSIQIIEKFNKGMEMLINSGEFDQIVKQYN